MQAKYFDVDGYHTVMAKYNNNKGAACEAMLETDSVGYTTVNQYYYSILKILRHQRSQNVNNLTNEHLRTDRVAQLIRVVQVRKKMIKKMQHVENIDHAWLPYMMVKSIEQIEAFLFSKRCFKHNYHITA